MVIVENSPAGTTTGAIITRKNKISLKQLKCISAFTWNYNWCCCNNLNWENICKTIQNFLYIFAYREREQWLHQKRIVSRNVLLFSNWIIITLGGWKSWSWCWSCCWRRCWRLCWNNNWYLKPKKNLTLTWNRHEHKNGYCWNKKLVKLNFE